MKRLSTSKVRLPATKTGGLKLVRAKGSIFGVCAGLSEYFGIEVRNIRIGFAALGALTFLMGGGIFKLTGVAIYAILAGILPKETLEKEEIRQKIAEIEAEAEEEAFQESLTVCPNCDTVSKPNSAYCHECGTRL
jgi:phage shock protein PspC (stress-responsive transcriptional regulator)